jgi:hypothetical protein
MIEITGPGGSDPIDPSDVDDLRTRVVLPVVAGLIRPPDLEIVDVGGGTREPVWDYGPPVSPTVIEFDEAFSNSSPSSTSMAFGSSITLSGPRERILRQVDDELWVLVTAAGSTWHSPIWQPGSAELFATLAELAWHFADQLEDWVCEDVYRGEQPQARIEIPSRPS